MAKITFSNVLSGFASASTLNQNFADIETELQDKVLYRNNPAGEPNTMENDLDMNANDILNAKDGTFTGNVTINGNLTVTGTIS